MIFVKRGRAPLAGERLMSEMNKLSGHIEELRSDLESRIDSHILRVTKSYSFVDIEDLDSVWYEALRMQFNDRCAYCESHIGSRGIAAYFRPVDGVNNNYIDQLEYDYDDSENLIYYIWLGYQWSNLILSCPECDYNKANHFPVLGKRARLFADIRHESNLIIDPCKDNPEEHLYYDSTGVVVAKSRKGEATINLLDLNRGQLVSNRKEEMNRIQNLLEYNPYLFLQENNMLSNEQFSKSLIRQLVAEWIAKLEGNQLLELVNTRGNLLKKIYGFYRTTKQLTDIISLYSDSKNVEYQHPEQFNYFKGNRIEYIKLRNVRGITFEKTFKRYGKNESWFMLLGENGTGKTTVLKAIAMALTGNWRGLGIKAPSFLTSGDDAEIIVKLEGSNEPVRVLINHRDVVHLNTPPPMPVVAYGAVRLIPSRFRRHKNRPVHWNNVRNLFSNSSTGYFVNHPGEWLNDQETLLRDIARTILDVLPFEEEEQIGMVVERGKAYIERNGRRIALHELSSGYQSVIALITDIARTLHQTSRVSKFAEGVVLIDEIDAHLHPSWKLTIVDKLRAAFPRMQFIVTSHDPLCLRGTHYGEIAVMKRSGDNVEVMKNLPDQEGMRVDQMLTSEFFDLNTTLDSKTDGLITQYQKLLSQRDLDSKDIDNLNAIENKLDDPLIRYLGYTNRERMMYQVIDEFIANRKKNKIAYNELDEGTKTELLRIWEMDDEDNQ